MPKCRGSSSNQSGYMRGEGLKEGLGVGCLYGVPRKVQGFCGHEGREFRQDLGIAGVWVKTVEVVGG